MERPQKRLQRLAGFVRHKSGLHVPAQEVARQEQADKKLAERRRITTGVRYDVRNRPKSSHKKIKARRKHSRKTNVRRLRQNKRQAWQNAR